MHNLSINKSTQLSIKNRAIIIDLMQDYNYIVHKIEK